MLFQLLSTRRSWYAVVGRLLGLLLLTAAGLKALGLAVGPVAQTSALAAPWLQLAIIELELFLGLWLLSGAGPRGSWAVALLTFAAFAAVSARAGWDRQQTCGCFGPVPVSPWYAFALDVGIVAVLLLARPKLIVLEGPQVRARGQWRAALSGAGAALVVTVLAAGTALVLVESPARALAHIRGEAITLSAASVDVGEGEAGENRKVVTQLTNQTDREVRVVGAGFSCACVSTDELPITLAPRETRSLGFEVTFAGSPGRFTRTAYWYIDDSTQRFVVLQMSGTVVNASSVEGHERH
jgi:hypothetical protein